ncbi:MAG TPA: PadR family transcriptional regulator [Thermoplasmata archaeon]|nr:PadR family transcriptional regulator [Thermoplasmata archaeon]
MQRFLGRLARELRRGVYPIWVLEELSVSGPTYGYQLLERLNARLGPGSRVGPSTLYPTLARLRRADCVEAFHGRESLGPVRKYYRITAEGRATLAAALELARQLRPAEVVPPVVGRDATASARSAHPSARGGP